MTGGADTTPRMLPTTIQHFADEARWDARGRASPTTKIIQNRGYRLPAIHTNHKCVAYVSNIVYYQIKLIRAIPRLYRVGRAMCMLDSRIG